MFLELGLILFVSGVIWLIVLSLRLTSGTTTKKIVWAIANCLLNPLAGIFFYVIYKVGLIPMLLIISGLVLTGCGLTKSIENVAR